MNDKISDYFADYAVEIVKFLGEDVKNYIIFNEPQVVVEDGHHTGAHAPFLKLSRKDSFKVAHNVLLCVGKAEKAMRKAASHKLNIGISPCYTPMMPINDEAAALKYNFTPNGVFEAISALKTTEGYKLFSEPLGEKYMEGIGKTGTGDFQAYFAENGSVAMIMRAVYSWIFGIGFRLDKAVISPCVPREYADAEVVVPYGNARLTFKYNGYGATVTSADLNGKALPIADGKVVIDKSLLGCDCDINVNLKA